MLYVDPPPTGMEELLEDCRACRRSCAEAVPYCLWRGNRFAEAAHVEILGCCADVCGTSIVAIGRGAELDAEMCAAAAQICERCADSCAGLDDETMRACERVSRRCAESFRRLAALGLRVA